MRLTRWIDGYLCVDSPNQGNVIKKLAAYEDAEEQGLLFPRWIPVTETMPPLGDRILIADGTGVWEGFLSSSSGFMRNAAFSIKDVYNTEITHWMPLPTPPEEDAE